jgi:hypothetical protein
MIVSNNYFCASTACHIGVITKKVMAQIKKDIPETHKKLIKNFKKLENT